MKSEITTIIKDYKFQTVIGMFDFERVAKQEVKVSLEFRSTSLIDYVLVADFIKEFYNEMKFQSVEESLEATCKALKERFGSLTSLDMEILKTEILPNAIVGAKISTVF
ncbi:dihydroneopterin aldolase [Campylobacter concisus]|uniref:dihydroneopterin aldolase n=1 Tax=Campylobacter concisus TaxID=199 RepID=UPI00122CBEFA|nr:dihydroneopterin aldolase [Campylobacter concisus]